MHSIYYKYAPKSFHDLYLHNVNRNRDHVLRNDHELQLPFVRIELFRRFPLYKIPQLWNNLGIELTHQSNKMTFSILLREYMFSLLSTEAFIEV
jgi:hypothetical protein